MKALIKTVIENQAVKITEEVVGDLANKPYLVEKVLAKHKLVQSSRYPWTLVTTEVIRVIEK